ncbi:MAG: c-type cytochrome [Saprospiraceae bacterium]|nr:c-type cytochrome [Saprospiraceae bacterium]
MKRLFLLLVLSVSITQSFAADTKAGKVIFTNNCAQCHAKSMKDKLTGPPLAGSLERWGNDKARYAAWIRNSQSMIAKGDPRAVAVWNEYKPTLMNAFPSLTDDDIDNIIAYIDEVVKGGGAKAKVAGAPGETIDGEKSSNGLYYGVAFLVLAALALVLGRIISNLNRTAAEKAGEVYVQKTLLDTLSSRGVVGMVVFALIVLGGYTTVNNAISLGRTQNYEPDQPIKFSHKTHSGLNKIDCQYCHDGARRSKQATIPPTSTCMNCHKAIKVGSEYGTAELTKIFASAGYNPISDKYIPNYDNLSEKEISDIYKKWIEQEYRTSRKIDTALKSTSDIRLFVDEQWNDIASSLKTKYKDKVQGPIQWVRLHNLPDHAYFNHAQHVAVGKVECQKCHGPVEKMAVVKQYAPLSMGWCINCHRETEVKFKDNAFYQSYERYHEEVKKGKREKVTVEDIGGLECQKCHY